MVAEQNRRGGQDKTFSDPYLSCKYGHGQVARELLTDDLGFESLLCKECLRRELFPIGTFSYPQIIRGFNEQTIYNHPVFQCNCCGSKKLSIIDVIQPEIFISFHHGYPINDDADSYFEVTPQIEQGNAIGEMIKTKTGILCWVTQKAPPENAISHWEKTLDAVKNCRVFIVLLSDSYALDKKCRREFEHAVKCGKFMIPVLLNTFPEDDDDISARGRAGDTGWTGPSYAEFLKTGNWFNHAIRLCDKNKAKDKAQSIEWSILKYFEPICLIPQPKAPEELKTTQEILWKTFERMWGGDVIDHTGSRVYAEWMGSRSNIRAELNRLVDTSDPDFAAMSKIEQMEQKALRMFQNLDTDGNGILDE